MSNGPSIDTFAAIHALIGGKILQRLMRRPRNRAIRIDRSKR